MALHENQNSSPPMPTRYPSKIDKWLGALILGAAAIELGVACLLFFLLANEAWARPASFLALAVVVFMLWVLFGTYYSVGSVELLIQSGPFRWRIPLQEITSTRPTRNPLSSPACSLDRLQIEYRCHGKTRSIMISPADKPGFLRDLTAAAPQVQVEN